MAPAASLNLDVTTLWLWIVYALVPALVGTVVYWLVTDPTVLETVVFAVVMVFVILAIDYFFDTIPGE